MATYNEYEDKETLIENPSIPDINKVKADDMNYIKYNLPHISNEVDEDYRVNLIKSNNLLNIDDITRDYYYTPEGVYTYSSGSGLTDYMEVEANTEYVFKGISSSNSNRRINYFDNNKQWLSQDVQLVTSEDVIITTPANTKYVRISYYSPTMNENTIGFYKTPYITPSIYVDNENIYSKEEVLFSGNQSLSTSSTTLTLNKNITDYNLIEIYYTKYSGSDSILSSLKIVPINNGYISPQIMFKATSNIIQQFWCLLKITTNAITLQDIGYVNYKISDNSVEVANNTGSFSIVKVIGYK